MAKKKQIGGLMSQDEYMKLLQRKRAEGSALTSEALHDYRVEDLDISKAKQRIEEPVEKPKVEGSQLETQPQSTGESFFDKFTDYAGKGIEALGWITSPVQKAVEEVGTTVVS